MSSNANAWRNLSTVSASTPSCGVSRMLKNPKSPLVLALVVWNRLRDDPRECDDTISVTPGSVCVAGSVMACSRCGRTPDNVGTPNKRLRDGTRSQDGIEGMPTDHPLPVGASFVDDPAEWECACTSELEPDTEGG